MGRGVSQKIAKEIDRTPAERIEGRDVWKVKFDRQFPTNPRNGSYCQASQRDNEMTMPADNNYSLRLTDTQAAQLDYLTAAYGSQATAFRTAIDLLYTLRKLDELGILDYLDIERLRQALDEPAAPAV